MLINLLPSTEKDFLREEKKFQAILFLSRIIFGALLILAILLLTILFFLKIQLSASNKAILEEDQNPATVSIKELKKEISLSNKKLEVMNKIQANQKFSPAILEALAELSPNGTQFLAFFYESKTQKAVLDGRTQSREDFISFKTAMETYPKFSQIESPLSNLVKSAGNSFRVSFFIER